MLILHGVSKGFGSRTVLKSIACRLEPGTVTVLAGANGAGKSTLLRIMAGLLAPDEGIVELHCHEAKRAYLGHATFVYPGLTALENLRFWDRMQGGSGAEDRLLDALARVELGRFADEYAGTFSRGMAQRLNLARVLLGEPRLLLLDEPGTGLDARSLNMLRSEVVRCRAYGAAVIWISHDLAGDAPLADRVLELSNKTLRQCSPDGERTC